MSDYLGYRVMVQTTLAVQSEDELLPPKEEEATLVCFLKGADGEEPLAIFEWPDGRFDYTGVTSVRRINPTKPTQ